MANNEIATFTLTPRTLDEAIKFAQIISESDIVPKDFKGKTGNVLVAIQMGAELGLASMQSLQNIAVINGRPALWGDAMLAVVLAHPECNDVVEDFDDKTMTATCVAKRKGRKDKTATFSQDDAVRAQLWGKDIYKKYPKRMLQMRARAFCLRDAFSDALRGIQMVEEVRDYKDMGDAEVVTDEPKKPPELPVYSDEEFTKNLPTYKGLVESGKHSVENIVAKLTSKYRLTDEQLQLLKSIGSKEETPDEPPLDPPYDQQTDDQWINDYNNAEAAQ